MSTLVAAEDVDLGRRGLWFRTNIYQEGHMLKAVTYCVLGTKVECFRAEVDLRPIAKAVAAYHKRLHQAGIVGDTIIGFLGGLKKAVKRIGRNKLVSKVYKPMKKLTIATATGYYYALPKKTRRRIHQTRIVKALKKTKTYKKASSTGKAVIQSKVTGALAAGAAVVYPPVGVPALAAYSAANAYLAAIDNGKSVYTTVARIAKKNSTFKKVAGKLRKFGKEKVVGLLRKTPGLKKYLAKGLKRKAAVNKFLKLGGAAKLKSIMQRKRMVQRHLLALRAKAMAGDVNARKGARVISLVAENRARLRALAQDGKGMPGLLITDTGRLVKGRFIKKATAPAIDEVLYQGARGTERGDFSRVGGPWDIVGYRTTIDTVGVGCDCNRA